MRCTLQDIVVRAGPPDAAPILDQVSLEIAGGERVAIVGANGSGKSTLARVLAGLREPASGRVVTTSGARVGLVLQDPAAQLVAATVADDVALGPELQGCAPAEAQARVAAALELLELVELAGRDPRELSGGQQQRVAIAGALAADADIVVLDEPTAHLDGHGRELVHGAIDRLAADGRAIAWATQVPEEVAWCDRVVALESGRVAFDGGIDAWLADPALATRAGVGQAPAADLGAQLRAAGLDLPPAVRDEVALVRALEGLAR